jgi:2-oxoglutarate dehydrogenase E1 component/2-oxoglutarate decarboxylase
VRRVVVTSGKLTYDLLKERESKGIRDVAIIRIERYYPFPFDDIAAAIRRYPVTAELVWAQEEPANMGAWRFVRARFLDDVPGCQNRPLRYVGRRASAAPAPGSQKVHAREQEQILREALD